MSLFSFFLTIILSGYFISTGPAQQDAASNLDIHLVSDEAEAVLSIIQELKTGRPVTDANWERLFSSQGYSRLKKREQSLKRPFEDEDFRKFVFSAEIAARADKLAGTLDHWMRADLRAAAAKALAYLPAGTAIRAKVYPVIKPQTNSFVFELKTDPAIFLYLDPEMNSAQFENTVAHELHHIGLAAACLPAYETEAFRKKPAEVRVVLEWAGAFGEGAAMLAAAGGPDVHPHAVSPAPDRERWDRDIAKFNADLRKVEKFFLDVLDGRLKGEEAIREVAFSFFGVQGPWYTVGWKMAVLIEKAFGRTRLVNCLCDSGAFLAAYNEAAAKSSGRAGKEVATWSPGLLRQIGD